MRIVMIALAVCMLAATSAAILPSPAEAQGICMVAGCYHCHTHDETPFTPKKHHFSPGLGSCYVCEGTDDHECTASGDTVLIVGSCGEEHEICQTEGELAAQQLLLAVWSGNPDVVRRRLETAKLIAVLEDGLTAITFAGCSSASTYTLTLPTSVVFAAPRTALPETIAVGEVLRRRSRVASAGSS